MVRARSTASVRRAIAFDAAISDAGEQDVEIAADRGSMNLQDSGPPGCFSGPQTLLRHEFRQSLTTQLSSKLAHRVVVPAASGASICRISRAWCPTCCRQMDSHSQTRAVLLSTLSRS